ncbi:MAG: pantetheine-phosphate adenylyltransferase [Planctomycetia bacterium]|nr:pantetheine-phosphate adenylyltransferase [Planctomycetia bacterium]
MKTIIYPGTFDPIHNGHIDIAERAALLFDKLIFVVADNDQKSPMFTVKERIIMIERATEHINNVTVGSTSDLIVNFAKREKAVALIRGLRHVSDFEFEFQMAMMNFHLNPEIITLFMMPDEQYIHINSTVIKNVSRLHGNISTYVPKSVEDCLNKKRK